jgi:flap endonuclease-1
MGIKNFSALLKWKAPDVKQMVSIHDLKGTVMGVDAHWVLYSAITGARAMGRDLTNEDGEITSHLSIITSRVMMMLKYGILPFFIYDGHDNEMKQEEIKKRKEAKEKVNKKRQKAINNEDDDLTKKLFKSIFSLSSVEIESSQKILDLLGIPWMTAPGEADIVLAYMTRTGMLDGVIADDSDILIHGAKALYPQFFKNIRKMCVPRIRLKDLRKSLDMNQEQLVELGVLMGSPYYTPPKGVGYKTAFNKLSSGEKFKDITDNDKKAKKAKKYFIEVPEDLKIKKPKLSEFQKTRFEKYLRKNGFQSNTIYSNKPSVFNKKL